MNEEIEIEVIPAAYTFDGLTGQEQMALFNTHNQGWKKDTPASLPIELQSYARKGDKWFSPLRQLVMATRRQVGGD